jgi:hypothetical protein
MTASRSERVIYVLTLQGKRGAESIRALRRILKRLLRDHSLRCVDAREVSEDNEASP